MSHVFIVGWDGATFDLIRPWIEQGKLPTLASIMRSGAHGLLRSTLPPMTFPAWSSFMTGKNPGKHGIFDFTRRRRGSYDLEFINGSHRRAASFWQILSQAGRQVISISVPCTFPPERVNGIMISGFDAPGLEGHGAYVDARGMYPPEVFDELSRNVGRHPIDSIVNEINQGRPDLGLEWIMETIRRKVATTKYLIANKPWDCCMLLFGESDGVGHHYWKYCDPNSPRYHESAPELRESILRVYQELDHQTGELIRLLPKETTVLIMSDHGFGGIGDWALYPNCWLRKRGFLRFRGRLVRQCSRALDELKLRAVNAFPVRLKRVLYHFGKHRLGGLEARVRYAILDWRHTEAYFEENPYYPAIWVNLKGRQPRGIVEQDRHYEEVRDRLIQTLESWHHPETGEAIVEKAYRREEVYQGPCVEDAPDIIVKWALHNGYSYAFKLSCNSPDLSWLERIDTGRTQGLEYFNGKSGHHRDNGIFLAQGPTIRSGLRLDSARIIDLAPTILGLLDMPVPEDMDGRILEEIFTSLGSERREERRPGSRIFASSEHPSDPYSEEDEQKIAARLKTLGYME